MCYGVIFAFQALSFYFMDCDRLPPPVIQVQNVSFRYSDTKVSLCVSQLAVVAAALYELLVTSYHCSFL